MIAAANHISTTPYIWGGGHGSWNSPGYDCSGSVSYVLHAAHLLSTPLTSGALESWGQPGVGRWVTVYANSVHTYAEIAGLRWDTVGDAQGTGPRWHTEPPYPAGFVVRHPRRLLKSSGHRAGSSEIIGGRLAQLFGFVQFDFAGPLVDR